MTTLVVVLAILILVNGIFVLIEGSLRRLRPGRLEEQADEGDVVSGRLLAERGLWPRYIRTAQLVRMFCALVIGAWIVLPISMLVAQHISYSWLAELLGILTVTFIVVTFSVLLPDNIAETSPEKILKLFLWPLRLLSKLLVPLTGASNQIVLQLLKFFGIEPQNLSQLALNEEELRELVSASQRGGLIDEVEEELIDNVLDFTDRIVQDIMIPRQDMAVIYLDDSFKEQLEILKTHSHTRFPLCVDDKDHILGMLHIRDLLEALLEKPIDQVDLKSLQRDVLMVPERMLVSELLNMMREKQIHLAVVVDEYGGTSGLVALEDILEELVGEINDEHDDSRDIKIEELPDGKYEMEGRVILEEVSDWLELDFDEEVEEGTIGGYLFRLLGKKPEIRDFVKIQNWKFTVLETEDFRILRVLAEPIVEIRGDQEES